MNVSWAIYNYLIYDTRSTGRGTERYAYHESISHDAISFHISKFETMQWMTFDKTTSYLFVAYRACFKILSQSQIVHSTVAPPRVSLHLQWKLWGPKQTKRRHAPLTTKMWWSLWVKVVYWQVFQVCVRHTAEYKYRWRRERHNSLLQRYDYWGLVGKKKLTLLYLTAISTTWSSEPGDNSLRAPQRKPSRQSMLWTMVKKTYVLELAYFTDHR